MDDRFKEMTKRLVDLADHVDEQFELSTKRSSPMSSFKKKSRKKKPAGRRVTWDDQQDITFADYFPMNKQRKASTSVKKLSDHKLSMNEFTGKYLHYKAVIC